MARAKAKTLAGLAASVGVIEDTSEGRRVYEDWLAHAPDRAQRPLVAALARRAKSRSRASGPATGRTARAGGPNPPRGASAAYPASWRPGEPRTPGVRTAKAGQERQASLTQDPDTPYPPGMLAGHAVRASVIDTRGGRAGERRVHAKEDAPAFASTQRQAAQQALAASQAGRLDQYSDPHDGIVEAGGNAARLEEMRRAEAERMEHEVWSRG